MKIDTTFVITPEQDGFEFNPDTISNKTKIKKTVYKVCDGCHAVVHEDGSVKVKSVTGKIINSVCGGGDMDIECWYNLFKA